MAVFLEPKDGPGYVVAGTSAKFEFAFWDFENSQFEKAAIKTLQMRLTGPTGSVINGRSATNVLDNDIGTLSAAGILTLKTTTLDNAFQGDSDTVEESHFMKLSWTWNDDNGDEQTSGELFEYEVRKAPGV